MFAYRPYRCQACGHEKEILIEHDGPCLDFCEDCSPTPERHPEQAHTVSAFRSTRTLRPFECIESWILVDLDLGEDVMARSLLFADMVPWQVKRVAMLGNLQDFQPGEAIVAQGRQEQSLYVLLEGAARVMITNESGRDVHAATFEAGEVFGEVALVLEGPRTASVIAATPARVLSLDAPALNRIGRFYPRIAFHLAHNIARILGSRFAGVNAELAEWKKLLAVL